MVPAACNPSEEHLGSLRRIALRRILAEGMVGALQYDAPAWRQGIR